MSAVPAARPWSEAALARWPRWVSHGGAGLFGLGVVVWVAANWSDWGRLAHFALLQGALAALCAAAIWCAAWRTALSAAAFLVLGGLLAYFGQTYQTGADPWQLFAMWALLGLPLALAVRGDALWALWGLVAMVGVTLWWRTWGDGGGRWELDRGATYRCWAMAMLLCVLSWGPALARWGVGRWARRALTLPTLGLLGAGALMCLMDGHGWAGPWFVALLATLLHLAGTLLPRALDVLRFSAALLLGNVLLVGLMVRLWAAAGMADPIAACLFIGSVAAGLLAGSVKWVMHMVQLRRAPEAGAHA